MSWFCSDLNLYGWIYFKSKFESNRIPKCQKSFVLESKLEFQYAFWPIFEPSLALSQNENQEHQQHEIRNEKPIALKQKNKEI